MGKNKIEYKPEFMLRLLHVYPILKEGKLPRCTDGSGRSATEAPTCEQIAIQKGDVDRAIKHLPDRERFVIMCHAIIGWETHQCARWLGCSSREIEEMEEETIIRMCRYLNTGK